VKTRRLVVQLLSSIGSTREIRRYLERFSSLETRRFAVVKVGGAILRDQMDELAGALSFLHQLGLLPVVLHGAGPQLDDALQAAGIEKEIRDGMRCTRPQAMPHVRRVMLEQNLSLVAALEANGARARSIMTGSFDADYLDEDTYGLVGHITGVNTDAIDASMRAGCIPVLGCLAETRHGQTLNVNADAAANALVRALEPSKIVYITGTGGLLDEAGEVISSVNLETDYEMLMAAPWLHSGMRLKLEQIHALLSALPPSTSVSITRPGELARELFTHGGSGTLVRRGERLVTHTDWNTIDSTKLEQLISSAFGRPLVADYIERTPLQAAYLTESYRAGAIISRHEHLARLDKFAVAEEARGEGLARVIWEQVRTHHAQLFWRARHNNPINEFYAGECDGYVKGDDWHVYWYGIDDFNLIRHCVEHVRSLPATLTGPAP
jgi:acetylglutamate kinase